MSTVTALLRSLLSGKAALPVRLSLTLLLIAAVTSFRSMAPAYIAPFLPYMPVLLIVSLAFGWLEGALALTLSISVAVWFYAREGILNSISSIALLQWATVGAIMIGICDALRRSILRNEVTLRMLSEAHRVSIEHQAALSDANATAEAARRDAERANLAKSAFIANMSHELRTPLSAIIGYSEMMMEEIEQGGDLSEFGADTRKIESSARHLLGLINDVLDLSKVESGKMDVYPETFDLEDLLSDVAATAKTLVDKNANRLELRISPSLGRMLSDLTKVRQILLNLLSNAAKFTENGTITLSVERPSVEGRDHVVFQVRDTGIGMTAEQLSRLFQRFVQADASTMRKYGGTGLGLSLVQAMSEILGGSIAVESQEGAGTMFTVRLPVDWVPNDGVTTEPERTAALRGDLSPRTDHHVDRLAAGAVSLSGVRADPQPRVEG